MSVLLLRLEAHYERERAGDMESYGTESAIHFAVCNVNLCPNCINEWHGVDMRDTNKLFGR